MEVHVNGVGSSDILKGWRAPNKETGGMQRKAKVIGLDGLESLDNHDN
jgi:hypothetical protein